MWNDHGVSLAQYELFMLIFRLMVLLSDPLFILFGILPNWDNMIHGVLKLFPNCNSLVYFLSDKYS